MILRARFSASPLSDPSRDASSSRRFRDQSDAGQEQTPGLDRVDTNAPGKASVADNAMSRLHHRRWFPLGDHADSRIGAERITKLLVIDDNVDVRFAMYEFLTAEGYDVAVAADGLQGVALARLTRPHAILLDLGMPALDGFSTARALRGMPDFAATPMIAVTGFFDKSHFDNARDSGFDYYFQKPVEIEALLDLLRGH